MPCHCRSHPQAPDSPPCQPKGPPKPCTASSSMQMEQLLPLPPPRLPWPTLCARTHTYEHTHAG
jgi:hypothetical protein